MRHQRIKRAGALRAGEMLAVAGGLAVVGPGNQHQAPGKLQSALDALPQPRPLRRAQHESIDDQLDPVPVPTLQVELLA